MGDFLRTVFGGSKTDQASQATSTPTNFTNPDLQNLAPGLGSSLQSLIQSLTSSTNNANPSGGATPTPQAPITGQESNLLSTISGQVGPGTASAGYIKDTLAGKYLPGQPNANPFFSDAVKAAQRPTLEGLTDTLTKALPGRFTAGGQIISPNDVPTGGGSSAFDNAAAVATRGVANAVGDIATNMGNTQFGQERQQQTAAAGLDQNEVNNTISALQASALPRLIQQNGLNQGLQLFQTQVTNLLDTLKTIGAVQAPTLANTSQSTSIGSSTSAKGIVPDLFKPV